MTLNIIGKQFGNLTILKPVGFYRGEPIWLCRCDCGNRQKVIESNLTHGVITHCGCRRRGRKREDIAGTRFGRLTAKTYEFDDKRRNACWLFHCECGTEKILPYNQVKWCGVRSCGCIRRECMEKLNKKDISNRRFGRLLAICPTEERAGSGSVVWECRCDCGNTAFYSVNELNTGNVRSCGCLYRDTRTDGTKNRNDFIDNTNISILVAAKKPRADNTSGVTGVYLNKDNKWIAYLSYKKKRYYLGTFNEKNDAVKARRRAEETFHNPMIEEHWNELPKERQDDYLTYLKGKFIEYPSSVNIQGRKKKKR